MNYSSWDRHRRDARAVGFWEVSAPEEELASPLAPDASTKSLQTGRIACFNPSGGVASGRPSLSSSCRDANPVAALVHVRRGGG